MRLLASNLNNLLYNLEGHADGNFFLVLKISDFLSICHKPQSCEQGFPNFQFGLFPFRMQIGCIQMR